MRRRYQTGGLALGADDADEDQDYLALGGDDQSDEQPGGAVTSAGGLAALAPGAEEAFSLMRKSAADARTALQEARNSIMARQYSRADALLAASAALGAPTKTGSTAESFGAMAGALRAPLAAQREFDIQKQKDLLGVNTQLAGLDEREAQARIALAQVQAKIAAQLAGQPNNLVSAGVDAKGHPIWKWASRQDARGQQGYAPPGTNIDMRQESAEAKTIGEGMAKQYLAIQQAGLDAPHQIAKYDRLSNLLEGVRTGRLTPTLANLASLAESFGIKLDPKLGVKQAISALSNEIALTLRNPAGGAGMPGALSDQDREFLKSMTPGLMQTEEGNKLIIEMATKLAQRDMEVAKLARQYRKKHGTLDEGFYDELEDFARENPLFTKKKEAAAAVTADDESDETQGPPSPAASGVPAIPSADDAAATEPGTVSFYSLKKRTQ